jgi:hypothetical protein
MFRLALLALVASAMFLGGCKPFGSRHKETGTALDTLVALASPDPRESDPKYRAERYNKACPEGSRKRLGEDGYYYDAQTGAHWGDFLRTEEGQAYEKMVHDEACVKWNKKCRPIWDHDFCK